MEKIKLGIIGTGFTIGIAKSQIAGLSKLDDCSLAALYDIVPGRAQKYVDDMKLEAAAYDEFEPFLAAVDAVSICTPNSTHVELMEKCLAAGKHVICEKPLSDSLEEAKKTLEFEKKYPNLVSMVVFNYRETPGVVYMKKLIDEGKLGKIFMFRYLIGGSRIGDKDAVKLEWRMQKSLSGTGALADFGCHVLDLIDYLVSPTMGKIKDIACFCETLIKDRTPVDGGPRQAVTNDDTTVMIATTTGGCLCSITASRLAIPFSSIEICGEGGTLSYVPHMAGKGKLTVHLKPINGSFSSPPQEVEIGDEYLQLAGHTGVLKEFVHCIKTGDKPVRNMEHGYYIQGLLAAFERAAASKTVLEV